MKKKSIDVRDADTLNKILAGKYIKPVYQPVVSLTDGEVFGYEALSRISDNNLEIGIEHMFKVADKINRAWELEALCRKKALKGSVNMAADKKLFLNVNPNVIHDKEFKNGFTKKRLEKHDLGYLNVVFEISERVAVIDHSVFLSAVKHYKEQNYGIAIDDVGSGYSGLNVISDVKPNIIKLDIHLVHDVDKDEIKRLLCKALADFCKSAGILLIAEGIETERELETLISLNVDFGQGYFLGHPTESFMDIVPEKIEMIRRYNTNKCQR